MLGIGRLLGLRDNLAYTLQVGCVVHLVKILLVDTFALCSTLLCYLIQILASILKLGLVVIEHHILLGILLDGLVSDKALGCYILHLAGGHMLQNLGIVLQIVDVL